MSSQVDVIIGSMFSGKSSELIRRCSTYESIKKQVVIINHQIDKRCKDDEVQTHSKTTHKAIKTNRLLDLEFEEIPDVIGIDEAQFFEDLYEFVVKMEKNDVKIIIAGLDGDFRRNTFGEILKCIPLADSVTKLHAMCSLCCDGTKASFTRRRCESDSIIKVGAEEEYLAVCRKHYFSPSNVCHKRDI